MNIQWESPQRCRISCRFKSQKVTSQKEESTFGWWRSASYCSCQETHSQGSIIKNNDVMWKRQRVEMQGCRGEQPHLKCSGRVLFLKRGQSQTPASVKFVYSLITHLHLFFFSMMIRLPEKRKIRTEAKWTFDILSGCCFRRCKLGLYLGNKGINVGFNVAPQTKANSHFQHIVAPWWLSSLMFTLNIYF